MLASPQLCWGSRWRWRSNPVILWFRNRWELTSFQCHEVLKTPNSHQKHIVAWKVAELLQPSSPSFSQHRPQTIHSIDHQASQHRPRPQDFTAQTKTIRLHSIDQDNQTIHSIDQDYQTSQHRPRPQDFTAQTKTIRLHSIDQDNQTIHSIDQDYQTSQHRPRPQDYSQHRPRPPDSSQHRPRPPDSSQHRPRPPDSSQHRPRPSSFTA